MVMCPVCIAVHIVFTMEGMFGYEVGIFFENLLPTWIYKPLYGCPPCMASIWGIIGWFVLGGGLSLWIIPSILSLCGWNAMASNHFYANLEDEI